MDFVFCDAPPNAPAVTYDMALEKLAAFYGITDVAGALSEVASLNGSQRPTWSQFKNPNKLGFLNGILIHSPDQNMREDYASKFYWTFESPALPAPDTDQETSCLNLLYARFIHPFKQHGRSSSANASPHGSTPSTPGGSSAALNSNAANPSHSNFRSALHKRDQVCLFCWTREPLDAAHLIAQKAGAPITPVIEDLLARAGLDSIYRVQNGILLCNNCHVLFDSLKRYIDFVDGRLIAKIVNQSNDPQNDTWRRAVRDLRVARTGRLEDWTGRQANDDTGEMLIYFVEDDTRLHPNHTALAFHKAACLIWKMAGAADNIEDDGTDDDESVDSLLAKVGDRLRSLGTRLDNSNSTLRLEDVQ